MQTTTLVVMAAVVGLLALLFQKATTQKCPHCKVKMRLRRQDVGKKKKFECPRCGRRVDTGVPAGKGRR